MAPRVSQPREPVLPQEQQGPAAGEPSREDRLAALRASRVVAPSAEALEAIDAQIAALVGGNGHGNPPAATKPSTAPDTETLTLQGAMGRLEAGADYGAIVTVLSRGISSGDLDLETVKAALEAAYPGQDFDAALLAAQPLTVEVPRLTKKDPRKSAIAYLNLTHREGDDLLLRIYQKGFYRWEGMAWRPLEEAAVESDLWDFLPKGHLTPRSSVVSDVLRAVKGQCLLSERLEPTCWIGAPLDGYPEPAQLVPMKSGFLHPHTKRMLPPTPKLFNLTSLPFEYDPADATSPSGWLRFLNDLWEEDPQSIECLQEIFGYLLTSDTSLQKMFLIIGPPRSGKGTIGRILTALLGRENVAAPSFSSLGGDHGLQSLRGKTAAIISDARSSGKADLMRAVEVLLNVSGEDQVTINPKFRDEVICTLRTRIIVMSNEVPRLIDASSALTSRFIALTMKKSFLGEEDPGLTLALMKELPQILHWALAGRDRLYERGYFLMPDSAREVMEEFEASSSPIKAFLRDKCKVDPLERVTVKRLWFMWCEWAKAGGADPGRDSWFGRDLRAALPKLTVREIDGTRTYCGVGESPEGMLP